MLILERFAIMRYYKTISFKNTRTVRHLFDCEGVSMNIKDVARIAGVSAATVSRAINNSDSVTRETKSRIMKIIEETGYVPNLVGRNLRQSKSQKLLAIIPDISNSFYTEILRGVNDVSDLFGYDLLLSTSYFNEKAERKALELLYTKQIDGVISLMSCLTPGEVETVAQSFPYVQCCEYSEDVPVTYVTIDNIRAAYDAASFFLQRGHTELAMISGRLYPMACKNREGGYQKALAEYGCACKDSRIVISDFSFQGGYDACRQLFSNAKTPPTALFVTSDTMAVGAIRFLQDAGIRVPEDVEVIGFDNNELAEFNNPTLSTVAQPRYEMGRTAAELLIKKIDRPDTLNSAVILPHQLIFRNSTR